MSKSLVRSFFNATKALQTLVAKGEKGLAALVEHSMAEHHHVICHFINLAKNSKKLLPSTQNRQEIDKEVYSYSAYSISCYSIRRRRHKKRGERAEDVEALFFGIQF